MKNHKKQRMTGKETQLSIVPGVTVIAVIMAAIFAVLFILLWRSDHVTLYFAGVFSSSSGSADKSDPSVGAVRIPGESEGALSEDCFFTPDFAKASESREDIVSLLRTVVCRDRLEQTFLISYQSGAVEMVSVQRDGDKYRVEAADGLVVCNGHIVYMRQTVDGDITFENRWNADEGHFSPEDEIGIPSIEELTVWVEQSEMMPRLTFDERQKTVSIAGIVENDLIRTVTLAYETGMILSASVETVAGEKLYQCDSVFYTLAPTFSENVFRIPMS